MKEKIKWTPYLSVGVGDIDIQHREFISILNKLAKNIKEEKNKKINDVISFLERYAIIHFNLEEMYMTVYSYPDSNEHMLAHNKFRKEIKVLKEKAKDRKIQIADISNRFKNWFFAHIKTTDIKLAAFLIKKIKN